MRIPARKCLTAAFVLHWTCVWFLYYSHSSIIDSSQIGVVHSVASSLTAGNQPQRHAHEASADQNDGLSGQHESSSVVLLHDLLSVKTRYYMYTDPTINAEDQEPGELHPVLKQLLPEVYFEDAVLQMMRNHSLRTLDPDEADLFFIPTPIGRIAIYESMSFEAPFRALAENPLWNGGRNHFLVATTWRALAYNRLRPHYDLVDRIGLLQNVSIGHCTNANVIRTKYLAGKYRRNDFVKKLRTVTPLTHYSFSTGLGEGNPAFPYRKATLEKFQNATYYLLYHTRSRKSVSKSTRYRHAPVTEVNHSVLPRSSIGWDLAFETWVGRFVDSQFCLVIRGDVPQTHALYRSVRAGCIPVVVCDMMAEFTAPFPAVLGDMREYCIFISDKAFLKDPQGELLKLQYLGDEYIQQKIDALALAQRVLVIPDYFPHEESLFVPALLKEVTHSLAEPKFPISNFSDPLI